MVGVGRRAAAGDDTASDFIAACQRSDGAYARRLAVVSAFGSRDGSVVIAALNDPSRMVRNTAAALVHIACDEQQATVALERIHDSRRRFATAIRLRSRGRTAPIEAFLCGALMLRNPAGAVRDMIGLCSTAWVAERLSEHIDSISLAGHRRLAIAHPELLVENLEQRLACAAPNDRRLLWQVGSTLEILAKRCPARLLPLVEQFYGWEHVANVLRPATKTLLRVHTEPTFAMLRRLYEAGGRRDRHSVFSGLDLSKVAHRMSCDQLAFVVAHVPECLHDRPPAGWYIRLSDAQRVAVIESFLDHGRAAWGAFVLRDVSHNDPRRERAYARWSAAAQDEQGCIAWLVLASLPRDLREREARRHLVQVSYLNSRDTRRLEYARFLPFAEATQTLAPWLGHPEGEQRAQALQALVATAHHQPNVLAQILECIASRKFEQDPVRMAMLGTLAGLKENCFTQELLEPLQVVMQHALDAADLSPATSGAVERIAVRAFRADPRWGAAWLSRIFRIRGHVSVHGAWPQGCAGNWPSLSGLPLGHFH